MTNLRIIRQDGTPTVMRVSFSPARCVTWIYFEQELHNLREYLDTQFGGHQVGRFSSLSPIYMPPKDRIIEIPDFLETCNEMYGHNLENVTIAERELTIRKSRQWHIDSLDSLLPGRTCQVIPPGTYQVGLLENDNMSSPWMGNFICLGDGLELRFVVGYSGTNHKSGCTIDWRGVKAIK